MGASELWKTLEHAIKEHTGLSPAIFFTFLSVAAAFFYAASAYFKPAPVPRKREAMMEPLEPLTPPVQLGEITDAELSAFDGSDPKKPLLMAIKGQIYDVTQSRMFYGPGGPYALFAGKDASRALAKMSFEQKDLTGDISGLGSFELDALQDWEYKFMSKYVKVGAIKKTVPVTDDSSNDNPITEATETAESKNFNPVSHDVVTVDPDVDTEKNSELKLAEPKEEDVGQAEDKMEWALLGETSDNEFKLGMKYGGLKFHEG